MKKDNWGLLGHEWAVDLLRKQVLDENVEHTYLLTGPPSIGRTTLALRFAQALNCEKPLESGDACRICDSCKLIDKNEYSDLVVIQSEYEGAQLKIKKIREIMLWLSLKPYQGNFRVAIFRRFQEANTNTMNALLKTLEEPPKHALLILVADTPEQLLPTITSRCEILRLRTPSLETLENFMQQNGCDPDEARLLAHISAGRTGYALRLKNSPDFLKLRSKWLDDLEMLLPADRVTRFEYVENLSRSRTNKKKGISDDEKEANVEVTNIPRQVLELWGSFWRDVMISSSGSQVPLVNIDRADRIRKLAGQVGFSAAHRMVIDHEKSIERMDRFVNTRLLLEVLLLDMPLVKEI